MTANLQVLGILQKHVDQARSEIANGMTQAALSSLDGVVHAIAEIVGQVVVQRSPEQGPRPISQFPDIQALVSKGIADGSLIIEGARPRLNDHKAAQLVNQLTTIAKQYGQTEQLRERIAQALPPFAHQEPVQEIVKWAWKMTDLTDHWQVSDKPHPEALHKRPLVFGDINPPAKTMQESAQEIRALQTDTVVPAQLSQEPWFRTTAELAAIYGEMCAINETPRKDQNQEQTDRLNVLRTECVGLHQKRIALNIASKAARPTHMADSPHALLQPHQASDLAHEPQNEPFVSAFSKPSTPEMNAAVNGALAGSDTTANAQRDIWVDVAIRGAMARAVFDAIRVAIPSLGPWSAFDATEVQAMADALKPFMPKTSASESKPQQEAAGHFLDFAFADSTAEVYVYDQFTKGQVFYAAAPAGPSVATEDQAREIKRLKKLVDEQAALLRDSPKPVTRAEILNALVSCPHAIDASSVTLDQDTS